MDERDVVRRFGRAHVLAAGVRFCRAREKARDVLSKYGIDLDDIPWQDIVDELGPVLKDLCKEKAR